MASPKRTRGFTLVELLVVITIIGMLVSLLLPAVQSAREAGRRNTCMSNMRQCALALNIVEQAKKGYPGYVNNVGGKRASWAVTILPQLEHTDLYRLWQSSKPVAPPANSTSNGTLYFDNTGAQIPNTTNPWAYTAIGIFNCPSKPSVDTTGNPLAFVVNCGSAWFKNSGFDNYPQSSGPLPVWQDDPSSGVFVNAFMGDGAGPNISATPSLATPRKVTVDFISTNDGSAYTVMMSENLQNSSWASDPTDNNTSNGSNAYPWQSDWQVKQQTGFVWWVTDAPGSTGKNNDDMGGRGFGINSQVNPFSLPTNVSPNSPLNTRPNGATNPPADGLAFSRPASQHVGGAGFVFCDGHYQFITEGISYKILTQLATPNQRGVAVDTNSPRTLVKSYSGGQNWDYLLNEADYQ